MGFWKTVMAGLLVVGLTKLFESGILPSSLDWLTNIAAIAWSNLTRPVGIPIWLIVVNFVLIGKLFTELFTLRRRLDVSVKQAAAAAAAAPQALEAAEPSQVKEAEDDDAKTPLDDYESTLLRELAHADGRPFTNNTAVTMTGFSKIRVDHTVSSLERRRLVFTGPSPFGDTLIMLTDVGKRLVIENELV